MVMNRKALSAPYFLLIFTATQRWRQDRADKTASPTLHFTDCRLVSNAEQ